MSTKVIGGQLYVSVPIAFEKSVGIKINGMQAWRYYTRGIAGKILPTVVIGNRRVTTLDDVKNWIQLVTEAKNAKSSKRSGASPSSESKTGASTCSVFLDREGV